MSHWFDSWLVKISLWWRDRRYFPGSLLVKFPALFRKSIMASNLARTIFLLIVIVVSMLESNKKYQQQECKPPKLYDTSSRKLISNAIALQQVTTPAEQYKQSKERAVRRSLGKRSQLSIVETKPSLVFSLLILIISGDVEQYPGPGVKFPCGICKKGLRSNLK